MKYHWPICGHQNIVNFLQKSIQQNNLSHAYLFYGPEHLGKTTLAENFINSLFCAADVKPCGQCQYCRQINKKIHPDLIWIKKGWDKKNIAIEQIRDLRQKLSLRSFLNSYQVAVIEEAEKMTDEASNALLKTLEEPLPKIIIILLINNLNFIPQTIVSRCQVFRFGQVIDQEIYKFLKNNYKTSDSESEILSRLSLGRPGVAINFIKNPQEFENYQKIVKDFIDLTSQDIAGRFEYISKISPKEAEFLEKQNIFQEMLSVWFLVVRDIILIQKGLSGLIVNLFVDKGLQKVSQNNPLPRWQSFLKKINQAKIYLNQNANPKLVLENLMLEL